MLVRIRCCHGGNEASGPAHGFQRPSALDMEHWDGMPRPSANRKPPYDISEAVAALCAADAKLRKLIERAGPFTLKISGSQSPFEALAESIIFQQLHGKAARAIHTRMLESFAGVCGVGVHPSPQHLLDCPSPQLRAAGLSHNKTLALRDLAAKTLDGTVPSLARIRRMDDEAIIEHLTAVRGVGRWTVEMFLIFRLGRPDVLPVSDYGVRKGFALTFGKLKADAKVTAEDLPKPDTMQKRAAKWHPWCSVASWYLWRACDLPLSSAKSESPRTESAAPAKTAKAVLGTS